MVGYAESVERRHEALADPVLVVMRVAQPTLDLQLVAELVAKRSEHCGADVGLLLDRIAILRAAGERGVIETVDADVLVEIVRTDDPVPRRGFLRGQMHFLRDLAVERQAVGRFRRERNEAGSR